MSELDLAGLSFKFVFFEIFVQRWRFNDVYLEELFSCLDIRIRFLCSMYIIFLWLEITQTGRCIVFKMNKRIDALIRCLWSMHGGPTAACRPSSAAG
jgi:hypothetical protein